MIRVAPPINIPRDQLDKGLDALVGLIAALGDLKSQIGFSISNLGFEMKQWSYFTLLATVALRALLAQQNAPSSRADGRRTDRDLANLLGTGTRRSPSVPRPSIRHLDVFQLTVPVSAISRSREFWKRVDEQSGRGDVRPAAEKRLPGRVAPAAEWTYFRGIIEQHPAGKRQMTVTAGDAGSLELLMKKVPDGQDLWYFTDGGRLIGRTYDRSENILQVSFQAAPQARAGADDALPGGAVAATQVPGDGAERGDGVRVREARADVRP